MIFQKIKNQKKNLIAVNSWQEQKTKTNWGFFSWLLVAVNLVAFFFIFQRFYFEWEKKRAIDQEVATLEQEIEKLKKEKNTIQEAMEYLKTSEFQEKELKDKLNLVKQGESVVYIKEKDLKDFKDSNFNEDQKNGQKEDDEVKVLVKKPNYYYWWLYFFSFNYYEKK